MVDTGTRPSQTSVLLRPPSFIDTAVTCGPWDTPAPASGTPCQTGSWGVTGLTSSLAFSWGGSPASSPVSPENTHLVSFVWLPIVCHVADRCTCVRPCKEAKVCLGLRPRGLPRCCHPKETSVGEERAWVKWSGWGARTRGVRQGQGCGEERGEESRWKSCCRRRPRGGQTQGRAALREDGLRGGRAGHSCPRVVAPGISTPRPHTEDSVCVCRVGGSCHVRGGLHSIEERG